MAIFYTIVWIGIIGFVLFFLYLGAKQKESNKIIQEKIDQDLQNIPFSLDKSFKYYMAFGLLYKLFGINKEQKKLVFYDYYDKQKFKTYDFKSIIDVKKIVDDEIISVSSTGSTIGRSLVGGALAGGIGAIIGGATSKKMGNKAIKNLELEILLNDIDHPSYRIEFFESRKAKEPIYDETLWKADEEIDEWLSIFKVILYQNEHPSDNKDVMN
jgi:hypothetical protein